MKILSGMALLKEQITKWLDKGRIYLIG